MGKRLIILGLALASWSASGAAQQGPLVETVADTGFIQLQAPSFQQLTQNQKELAYWLTQASIAIDPVIYDQLSRHGLRQKRLLEGIMSRREAVPAEVYAKVREYALLFWANRGNHNETTAQKFLPSFTPGELQVAALQAQAAGAFAAPSADLPPIAGVDALAKELADLNRPIFDASFEPMITAKTPPPGQDILQASANNFYQGVSLADMKGLQEKY